VTVLCCRNVRVGAFSVTYLLLLADFFVHVYDVSLTDKAAVNLSETSKDS